MINAYVVLLAEKGQRSLVERRNLRETENVNRAWSGRGQFRGGLHHFAGVLRQCLEQLARRVAQHRTQAIRLPSDQPEQLLLAALDAPLGGIPLRVSILVA